jgi:hypothetical protein
MARTRWIAIAVLISQAAACGDSLEPACLPVVRPAVEVEVRDALTEEFRAESARGVVQDGSFTDSLEIVRYDGPQIIPSTLGGAYERPGIYSVRIQRDGYQPWDTSGLRVEADKCGAAPVQIVARLSPTS